MVLLELLSGSGSPAAHVLFRARAKSDKKSLLLRGAKKTKNCLHGPLRALLLLSLRTEHMLPNLAGHVLVFFPLRVLYSKTELKNQRFLNVPHFSRKEIDAI